MNAAFEVHKLNSRGMAKAQRLASAFDTHLSIVQEIVGEVDRPFDESLSIGRTMARESSTFLMMRSTEHLELASFYAKKCLAQKLENQDFEHGVLLKEPIAGRETQEAESPVSAFLRLLRGVRLSKHEADMLIKAVVDQHTK